MEIGINPEEGVEHFEAAMYFPPQIEVKKAGSGTISVQPEGFRFASHTMVRSKESFLSKTVTQGYGIVVFSNQIGNYKILVEVGGKGLRPRLYQLTLNVRE